MTLKTAIENTLTDIVRRADAELLAMTEDELRSRYAAPRRALERPVMPNADGTVTPTECIEVVRASTIDRTQHHRCGGCGYMTGYVFAPASEVYIDPSKEGLSDVDLVVGFDAGRDCSRFGPAPHLLRLNSYFLVANWAMVQLKAQFTGGT